MPSPGTTVCRLEDLSEGDVLLCLGTHTISQLIARLEEGSYSHAAYCPGDGSFIHATVANVVRQPVDALLDAAHYRHADVYRPKVFGSALPRPVTTAVSGLVGRPYDHTSLWMVAVIVGLQSPIRTAVELARYFDVLQEFAEREYGPADGAIGRLTAALSESVRNYLEGDQARLTCTEVVTTGFWNADEGRKYALEFDAGAFWARRLAGIYTIRGAPDLEPPPVDPRFRDLVDCCRTAVEGRLSAPWIGRDVADRRHAPDAPEVREVVRHLETLRSAPVRAGTGFWDLPLNMISPRQMERSASLRFAGRLVP